MKAIWVVCVVMVGVGTARACSCAGSLKASVSNDDAVFTGTVLSTDHDYEGRFSVTRLRVLKAWKGAKHGRVVEIRSGRGGGECGVDFATGSKYLVLARRAEDGGPMWTSICDHTGNLREVSEAVDSLRGWKVAGQIKATGRVSVEK
jgi:hypothetical protein